MKKKNMVWIILCFVIAGATGCQSTKKELPSVETEAQEEVQTETQTEVETIEDKIFHRGIWDSGRNEAGVFG